MAQITSEWLQEKAKEVMACLDDGFQYTDLFKMVPIAMEIVESVGDLSGEDKLATFVNLMTVVIETTDTPWVPDALVDPIMIRCLEPLAEMAIKFSKGEVEVNA